MIFILILSLAFVIIFNKIMFGKFFSFLNLIQLLWHTIAIISLYGFYNTFIPSIKTYVYILIFLYSIELGYLIFYKKSESIKKKNEAYLEKQELNWKCINWVLILCNGILFIFVVKSFPYLLQGLATLRDAYLNCEINSNKMQMLISIVVFSLGHAAGMYSVIDFVYTKKIRPSLFLYAGFLIEIILMTGGRGHILLPAGIACIALIDKYKLDFKKMLKENKIIFLIAAIVLIVFICLKFNERNKNEDAVKAVVAEIENIPVTDEEESTPYIEFKGYQVIGTIKIDELGIEYPILIESTEDSLEKSISRVGNGRVNEVGNLVLAGHNYIDGTMFGNIDKLENNDTITILDLHGNEVTYSIFDIFIREWIIFHCYKLLINPETLIF